MTSLVTKLTVVGLAIAIVLPAGAANAFQFNSTMQNHAVFEEVMLNPQPLPPGPPEDNGIIIVSGMGDSVSLNPQPLPPKYLKRKKLQSFGDTVSLNPQPLPPKLFFSFGG